MGLLPFPLNKMSKAWRILTALPPIVHLGPSGPRSATQISARAHTHPVSVTPVQRQLWKSGLDQGRRSVVGSPSFGTANRAGLNTPVVPTPRLTPALQPIAVPVDRAARP